MGMKKKGPKRPEARGVRGVRVFWGEGSRLYPTATRWSLAVDGSLSLALWDARGVQVATHARWDSVELDLWPSPVVASPGGAGGGA